MDVVIVVTFLLLGEPGDTFFSTVGEKLGGGASVGIALHNFIGLSGGLLFAILVLLIERLRIGSMKTGLLYGLGAGAATIPLGCVPMAIWLGQPVLEVVAFSVTPHLVWGLALGWCVAFGLLYWERQGTCGQDAGPIGGY